jgi:hypothetical protein
MTFQEAYEAIKLMNIDTEGSLVFKTGVILLYGSSNETFGQKRIHTASQEANKLFTLNEIRTICDNLHKNNIIDYDGTVDIEVNGDPLNVSIEFALICGIGAGEICRVREKNLHESDFNDFTDYIEAVNKRVDDNLITPLPNRSLRAKHNGEDFWMRPIKLTETKLKGRVQTCTCEKIKQGQIIEIDVSEIYQISGKKKTEVEAIKNCIINKIAFDRNAIILEERKWQLRKIIDKKLKFHEYISEAEYAAIKFSPIASLPEYAQSLAKSKPKKILFINADALLEIQKKPKQRHAIKKSDQPAKAIDFLPPEKPKRKRRKSKKINPVAYLPVQEFAETVIEADKVIKDKKKIDWDKIRKAASGVVIVKEDQPYIPGQVKIDRPPAEYTNKSPYGIASDMLLEQLKK